MRTLRPRFAALASRTVKPLALFLAAAVTVGGLTLVATGGAQAAPHTTIWGEKTPRAVVLDDDRQAVELGTRFTARVDGSATGVRFFKVDGVKGKHTGTLWSTSGKKLASVEFTNESSRGWQSARFNAPVTLKAGTSYVVSYSVPAGGRYATSVDRSVSSTSPHLSVGSRNSGVYSYDKRSPLPTKNWRSSQYWVDVTFVAKPAPVAPKPTITPTATPKPTATPTSRPTTTPVPTATPKPTPAPTATATPTPKPTATATPAPPVTPPAPPVTTPEAPSTDAPAPVPAGGFPTRESAGLPDGWSPRQQVTGDYWIRTPGQVVEDLKITNGAIYIAAPNVTLRRIQGAGAYVRNGYAAACQPGLVIEDSEFTANGRTSDRDEPVIGHGGYTVRNVMIDGVPEGLRVGATDIGCGPVTVERSFIRVVSPDSCTDWHGDALQGYGGAALTVRQSTMLMQVKNNCWGTAPFFYPSGQGNTSVDIDGLLVGGGGYPFRNGMPGPVRNLNVIDNDWVFGPVDVRCSVVTNWSAQAVRLDAAGQPIRVRSIGCTGVGN